MKRTITALALAGLLALAGCGGGSEPAPRTCAEADGPYVKGQDPEYDQFEDRDGDGVVCE
jgi:micrococcal nuclease